jgi:DNA-binding MarR family transcriptional regulator
VDQDLVNKFYTLTESMRKTAIGMHCKKSASKSEFSMLQFIELCHNKFGMVTTAVLSEKLNISKPAVSQMINVLEQKQLVERQIFKDDRRLWSISLTEKGNQVLKEGKNEILHKINIVLDKMGKEDSVIFLGLLEKYFVIFKEVI